MTSFIKETSNAWSASFRKGQRVLVLPYTSFLFFANQLGTSWHLCAHHIKLADGRTELLLIHALQQVKEKIPVCQDALPYTVIQLTYSISLLLLLVSRYGWETCVHEVISYYLVLNA